MNYQSVIYVVFSLGLLLGMANSSIYRLDREKIGVNQLSEYQSGMFSKDDTPFKKNKDAKIIINLDFEQNMNPLEAVNLQAILFHTDLNDYIGKKIDDTKAICCWTKYFEAGECDRLGQVIIQKEAYGDEYQNLIHLWDVGWFTNTTIKPINLKIQRDIKVPKSGVWDFAMIYCGDNETVSEKEKPYEMIVTGSITFLNPYGELPGDILGLMPVFLFCFVGFLAGTIWWAIISYISYVRHKEELLFLQKCIAVVLMSGVIENLLYFLDYLVYNYTGDISLTFNVISVFALVFKRTACFVCLLMITSGYTILYPTMTKKFKFSLATFGVLYAIICWLYEFVRMLRYTPATQYLKVSSAGEYFLLAIISVLDFCVLLWIFYLLFKTMSQLLREKQTVKFQHFKKLAIVLGLAYLASLIFFAIQAYASWTSKYTKWWKGWWVWDGYWAMLYLFLVLIVAFLWRPSGNNRKFTYSAFGGDDEVELPETNQDDVKLRFRIQSEDEDEDDHNDKDKDSVHSDDDDDEDKKKKEKN